MARQCSGQKNGIPGSVIGRLNSLQKRISGKSYKLPVESFEVLLDFDSKYSLDFEPSSLKHMRPRITSFSYILRANKKDSLADRLEELSSKLEHNHESPGSILCLLTELAGTGDPKEYLSSDMDKKESELPKSLESKLKKSFSDLPILKSKLKWKFLSRSLMNDEPNPMRPLAGMQSKKANRLMSTNVMAAAFDANHIATDISSIPESLQLPALNTKYDYIRYQKQSLETLRPSAFSVGTFESFLSTSTSDSRWGCTDGFLPIAHSPQRNGVERTSGLRIIPWNRKLKRVKPGTIEEIRKLQLLSRDLRIVKKSWAELDDDVSRGWKGVKQDYPSKGKTSDRSSSISEVDWDGYSRYEPCRVSLGSERHPSYFDDVYKVFLQHMHTSPSTLTTELALSKSSLNALKGIPSLAYPLIKSPVMHDDVKPVSPRYDSQNIHRGPDRINAVNSRLKSCGPTSISKLLSRVGNIGTIFRNLVKFTQKYSNSHNGGLVLSSFARGVKAFLDLYEKQILELPQNAATRRQQSGMSSAPKFFDLRQPSCNTVDSASFLPTLMEIDAHTETLQGQLIWISEICQTSYNKKHGFPRGAKLLSYLFECGTLSAGGEATDPLFQYLLETAFTPYLKMLREWVCKGVLHDPFNEFMVNPAEKSLVRKDEISSEFQLVMSNAPIFLLEVAQEIFESGCIVHIVERSKSRAHLELCRPSSEISKRVLQMCFTDLEAQSVQEFHKSHIKEVREVLKDLTEEFTKGQEEKLTARRVAQRSQSEQLRLKLHQRTVSENQKLAEIERKKKQALRQIEAQIERKEERIREAKQVELRREQAFRRRENAKRKHRIEAMKNKLIEKHKEDLKELSLQRERLLWRRNRMKNSQKRERLILEIKGKHQVDLRRKQRSHSRTLGRSLPAVRRSESADSKNTSDIKLSASGNFPLSFTSIPVPTPNENEILSRDKGLSSGGGRSSISLTHSDPVIDREKYFNRFRPPRPHSSRIKNPIKATKRVSRGLSSGGGRSTIILGTYKENDIKLSQKMGIKTAKSDIGFKAVGEQKPKKRLYTFSKRGHSFGGGSSSMVWKMFSYPETVNTKTIPLRRRSREEGRKTDRAIIPTRVNCGILGIGTLQNSECSDGIVCIKFPYATAYIHSSKLSSNSFQSKETPIDDSHTTLVSRKLWTPLGFRYLSKKSELKTPIGEKEAIADKSLSIGPLSLRLRTVFERSLIQGIHVHNGLSNATLCNLLIHHFQLKKHLEALRKYMLMTAGDLFDSFSRTLFDGMYGDPPMNWMSTANLNNALRSSLRLCGYDADPFAKNLRFCLRSSSDRRKAKIEADLLTLNAFDGIELKYEVDWPVSTVINPSSMEKYAQIFNFLLKLKRVHYELRNIWTLLSLHKRMSFPSRARRAKGWLKQKHTNGTIEAKTHHWRHVEVFLMEMRHLVNNFEGYVMTQVLSVPWAKLEVDFECAHTLSDLRHAHFRYISTAASRLFLTPESKLILMHVERILSRVLIFKTRTAALDFSTQVRAKDFEGLKQVMHQSRADYLKLFRAIKLHASRGVEPLRDLVTRLNYNGFFSQSLWK